MSKSKTQPGEELLRQLPSVEELARKLYASEGGRFPRKLIVEETRRVIAQARTVIQARGELPGDLETAVRDALEALAKPSLRRVINATGVVLHTNLGRAPLTSLEWPGLYTNLEYEIGAGKRGRRDTHFAPLLDRLLGKSGIAVNNGAAAVYLVLHELAAGGEVVVSRGELIEIGDGFRIPDIMARSGAKLVEVGATNKTRIEDYRSAITERTRLIMRVHPSNFRIQGFTGRPELTELAALAKTSAVPLYEDLGSGNLFDWSSKGIDEPTIKHSLEAGVDVVSFSGDKLLGGPQAGIIAGRQDLVERVRRNPMFRALRLDKLAVSALSATLRHILLEEWDALPALKMIKMPADAVRARAERVAARVNSPSVSVIAGESVLGGGSTPEQRIPTWLIAVRVHPNRIERALRAADPPVIGRIEDEMLLLDLRTVAEYEDLEVESSLREALRKIA